MPVLNGDHGLLQALLLAGAQQVAATITADLVPASGHTFAQDNPASWVAQRLHLFLWRSK